MSSAGGYVQTRDGQRVGYVHYQGSADCLCPHVAIDSEEAWRVGKGADRPDGRNEWDVARDCEHPREAGYVYTSYGRGFWWPVEFCRECMVIHGPLSPYTTDHGWGCPTPEQQARDDAWRSAGWPKDGTPPIDAEGRSLNASYIERPRWAAGGIVPVRSSEDDE